MRVLPIPDQKAATQDYQEEADQGMEEGVAVMKTEVVQRDPVVTLELSLDEFKAMLTGLLEAEARGWCDEMQVSIIISRLKAFAEDNSSEIGWW